MKLKLLLLSAAWIVTGSFCFAAPITPHYTTFGTLAGATFGGSGIPNDAVAITTIATAGDTITLGLTATQHYSNPALTNDMHGTFFAMPGTDMGDGNALWNFDFYINLAEGMGNTNLYDFKLVVQDNTTDVSQTIDFGITGLSGTAQDSESLSFATFGTVISFDPNAQHQYAFELQAFDAMGTLLNTSAINVNVGSPTGVPDSGTTLTLLGLGVIALGGLSFRKGFARA